MRIPLITLIVLFAIFIFIGTSGVSSKGLADYCINISVEILGAIITVICIDIFLGIREKKIANKREMIAWTLLKPIIRSNCSILFTLYKNTTSTRGRNLITSQLPYFFDDDYCQTILHLNIHSDAPVFPKSQWISYLKNQFENINKDYENILDKYAIHLDPDLVGILESLKNSLFHKMMTSILFTVEKTYHITHAAMPPNIFEQLFGVDQVIKPYLKIFKQLLGEAATIELMNNFFTISDESWNGQIGGSRLIQI